MKSERWSGGRRRRVFIDPIRPNERRWWVASRARPTLARSVKFSRRLFPADSSASFHRGCSLVRVSLSVHFTFPLSPDRDRLINALLFPVARLPISGAFNIRCRAERCWRLPLVRFVGKQRTASRRGYSGRTHERCTARRCLRPR